MKVLILYLYHLRIYCVYCVKNHAKRSVPCGPSGYQRTEIGDVEAQIQAVAQKLRRISKPPDSYRAFLSRWRRETARRGWWGRQVILLIPAVGRYQWRDGGRGWHIRRLVRASGKYPPTAPDATYEDLSAIRDAFEAGAAQVEERSIAGGETMAVLLAAHGIGPGTWTSPNGGRERVEVRQRMSAEYWGAT